MEHAIFHLNNRTSADAKFAVLHADNAVELALKEIVRFNQLRLIDKKGQSISYYSCIEKLTEKGISIPELTDLDLLHTERNNVYHLGSQPDQNKAEWLVYDVALNFVDRVCRDFFQYDIRNYSESFTLTPEIKKEIETTSSDIVNKYLNEVVSSINLRMYESALLLAYTGIEAVIRSSISSNIRSQQELYRVLRD